MKDTGSTTPHAVTPADEPLRADSDLRALWRFYAHKLSDTGLVACVALSILSVATFAVIALTHARWALRWWALVLPPIFAGAFGAWGIANRELTERRRVMQDGLLATRILLFVEWSACVVAALAAAAAVIAFLRITVGTWIS